MLPRLPCNMLYGNAEKARDIMEHLQPAMTKEEYISFQNKLFRTELYDGDTGESREMN